MNEPIPLPSRPVDHVALAAERAATARAHRDGSQRIAMARLVVFFVGLGTVGAALRSPTLAAVGLAVLVISAFVALVVAHGRVEARAEDAEARRDVHLRHAARVAFEPMPGPAYETDGLPPTHPYARDLDLVGPGSLVARFDCTHTRRGHATLVRMLAAPADVETIRARQAAVVELAERLPFREALEASARTRKARLDDAPFLEFTRRAPRFSGPALTALRFVLPVTVVALYAAASLGRVPTSVAAMALVAEGLVALAATRATSGIFSLVSARHGYLEAYAAMLEAVEQTAFEAPHLASLRARVHAGERPPSSYMASLSRWAGLAEFRTQFPLHFFVNLFTLWDLHVAAGLERWNRAVGAGLDEAFEAVGELEALSSLACLATTDPGARMPSVEEGFEGFVAVDLAHPLLASDVRVPNSLELPGRGAALLVTGSNMAGKSTLLRSVGTNLALALAGGPVIAASFRTGPARLRASMRVDDSLARGASYFHAELERLKMVVADLEDGPPVFFLLDELLRGTNAEARSRGAKAVVEHLLDRGALGLVATHDLDLARLEEERPGHVRNRHFTDVMVGGEMRFDYILREGVVRSSNALRLLSLAGIAVADEPPRG